MSPTGFMGLMVIASPFFGISEVIYKLLFNETNEAGFWFIFFVCFLIVLYAYPILVFYRKEGRKKRAYRFAKILLTLLLVTKVTAALEATIDRNFISNNKCTFSTSPGSLYTAELCKIKGGEVSVHFIVRVYDAKNKTLIAEKEGITPWDKFDFDWVLPPVSKSLRLDIGIGDNSVSIDLPPSFIDKLLAKLP